MTCRFVLQIIVLCTTHVSYFWVYRMTRLLSCARKENDLCAFAATHFAYIQKFDVSIADPERPKDDRAKPLHDIEILFIKASDSGKEVSLHYCSIIHALGVLIQKERWKQLSIAVASASVHYFLSLHLLICYI
ncbi:hypothetical protein ACJX0J_006588, partial [Zea mays]